MSKRKPDRLPNTGDPTHNLWTREDQSIYERMLEYERHLAWYEGRLDHPVADGEALDRWAASALDWGGKFVGGSY